MNLTDKQKDKLDKCISRGVKFLNKKKPGWAYDVDLRKLDMTSYGNCVAGQVLGEDYWIENYSDGQARCGFNVEYPLSMNKESWAYLNQKWKETIQRVRLKRSGKEKL